MYDKVCPKCGTHLISYYETGYLGCPYCYKAFKKEITATIEKIQGSNFHVGKSPSVFGEDKKLLINYRNLIKQRENAGLENDFSSLAELSEEISSLYEELKRRGLL